MPKTELKLTPVRIIICIPTLQCLPYRRFESKVNYAIPEINCTIQWKIAGRSWRFRNEFSWVQGGDYMFVAFYPIKFGSTHDIGPDDTAEILSDLESEAGKLDWCYIGPEKPTV